MVFSNLPLREYCWISALWVLFTQILPRRSLHMPCGPSKPVRVPWSFMPGIVKMYTSLVSMSEMKSSRGAFFASGETHDF